MTSPRERASKSGRERPRPWLLRMRWSELAFLHWPVPAEPLARALPPGLELERHEGEAWLGVVPFRMSGVRLRGLPPIPTTHAFLELNLRTYVRRARSGVEERGVWFFSLDAQSLLAVLGARAAFHLPYFHARMRCERRGETIEYASARRRSPAAFRARYRPLGAPREAAPGSLEAFLTDRLALFAWDSRARRLLRGDIEHGPWPLQACEVELEHLSLEHALGLALPREPALAHYAERLDVHARLPERA